MKKIIEVVDLKKLVPIQKNMIISSNLFKDKNCQIQLFSFDKGEDINSEIYSCDVIYYVVEGKLQIYLGEEHYEVLTGGYLKVPKDIGHGIKAQIKSHMIMIRNGD